MTLSFLNDETEAKREVTSLARGLRAKGAGVRRQASDCGLSSPSLLEMTSSLGGQGCRGTAGPKTEETSWGNRIQIWKRVLTRMSTSIRYESVTTAFALERACLCPFVS